MCSNDLMSRNGSGEYPVGAAAVKELGGELTQTDAGFDPKTQSDQIDSLVATKPDALFITPADAVAIAPAPIAASITPALHAPASRNLNRRSRASCCSPVTMIVHRR